LEAVGELLDFNLRYSVCKLHQDSGSYCWSLVGRAPDCCAVQIRLNDQGLRITALTSRPLHLYNDIKGIKLILISLRV